MTTVFFVWDSSLLTACHNGVHVKNRYYFVLCTLKSVVSFFANNFDENSELSKMSVLAPLFVHFIQQNFLIQTLY